MMDQSQILKNQNYAMFQNSQRPIFFTASTNSSRSNWNGKRSDQWKELRRNDPFGVGGDFQSQNRLKTRRYYPKKKFNNRFAPFAPRNTTSFLIRAKKSGGIASLVSPCPVTPAILPTPMFSPAREVLVDMAKEEWGVDGYGSMKGLIRLRSPREEDEEEEGGSSDTDVEEHVEVERRLDHDLSRFEMIYHPNSRNSDNDEHTSSSSSLLENRGEDQDNHIAQLEEENLTLKEKLFLMERELDDLKRRVQCLETDCGMARENSEEGSENDGGGDVCSEKSVGD